jgi:trk system potassium uptake protein TrkA
MADMRIVIVGGGEVGFALAGGLARDHDVFVVDHAREVGERFATLDVQFVHGSGTSADVLRRARADEAELLLACTGHDEVNLVACAIGRSLGLRRTICFVSDEGFLSDGSSDSIREHFGIERFVWPEAQLADDIERIIAAPGAIDAEVFAGGVIRLLEYRLDSSSMLISQPLGRLHLPRGSLIVAVKRGGKLFVPRGTTQLAAGDKIILMGTREAMGEVEALMRPPKSGGRLQVTIIGGGDVGLELAERLEKVPSVDLRILERSVERGEMLAARLRRTLVLNGDGTDLELLEAENVGRSDVLVCVIDNDERNLLASLLGRQLGVPKVVTRVGRPTNLRLFERVGIDVALSARGAAVASILHQVTGGTSSLLAVLEHGEARVLELVVSKDFAARPLKSIGTPVDAIVGAILRDGGAIVPRGDDRIEPGDRILVFSTRDAAERVQAYFSGTGN